MANKPDTYAQLCEPLPPEALKQHPSKTYLTTINPMYVVDRLNNVFGIGKWQIHYDIIEADGKMPVVKGTLIIPEIGVHIEQFGGNDNADRGDAWKGAATDALTKCASYLGVGRNVWMNIKPEEPTASETTIKNILALVELFNIGQKEIDGIKMKLRPGVTQADAKKIEDWIKKQVKKEAK